MNLQLVSLITRSIKGMRKRVASGRVGYTTLFFFFFFFFCVGGGGGGGALEGKGHMCYVWLTTLANILPPPGSISTPGQYILYCALAAYNIKYIALVVPLISPRNMIQNNYNIYCVIN